MQVQLGLDCMLEKNKKEFFKFKDQAIARHKELYWEYGVLLDTPFHDVEFNCWVLEWCNSENKILGFNTDLKGKNSPNAV